MRPGVALTGQSYLIVPGGTYRLCEGSEPFNIPKSLGEGLLPLFPVVLRSSVSSSHPQHSHSPERVCPCTETRDLCFWCRGIVKYASDGR